MLRLGEEAYAVSVRDVIEKRTGRTVSRGAVYVTLDRMERRKGYLRSKLGPPAPERGGKAKRLFGIEPRGLAVLQTSLRDIEEMVDGLSGQIAWSPSR